MSSDTEQKLGRIVKEAWKSLNISKYDTRDFVTAVRETREERDRLLDEVENLKRRLNERS